VVLGIFLFAFCFFERMICIFFMPTAIMYLCLSLSALRFLFFSRLNLAPSKDVRTPCICVFLMNDGNIF